MLHLNFFEQNLIKITCANADNDDGDVGGEQMQSTNLRLSANTKPEEDYDPNKKIVLPPSPAALASAPKRDLNWSAVKNIKSKTLQIPNEIVATYISNDKFIVQCKDEGAYVYCFGTREFIQYMSLDEALTVTIEAPKP